MGLRFDIRKMQRDLNAKRARIRAEAFRPEMRQFAKKVLATCIQSTPARSLATIRNSQRKQYAHRINYIPSVHTLEDPTLIVNDAGEYWLYASGKWYAASYRQLPADLDAILSDLLNERQRRLSTPEPEFIAERAQSRFLYKKSWYQVALSLGISMQVSSAISQSHSRHEPPKEPPRGYGQWRGGKHVLTVVVFNPFLEQESRYKPFSGKAILAEAIATHRPELTNRIATKLRRMLIES